MHLAHVDINTISADNHQGWMGSTAPQNINYMASANQPQNRQPIGNLRKDTSMAQSLPGSPAFTNQAQFSPALSSKSISDTTRLNASHQQQSSTVA